MSGGLMSKSNLKAVTIANSKFGGIGHSMHRSFELNEEVEMVALADPYEEGRIKYAKECGAKTHYADYREMLEKEKPDIAVIARHWFDDSRIEEISTSIDLGVKGLFVEKTLAAWPYQARAIQKEALMKKIPILMAHRSREHPIMQEIRHRSLQGEWGPLTRIRSMDKGDHRCGVYEAMLHTPHIFDAMLYLAGEKPASCWGSVTHEGVPVKRKDTINSYYDGAGPMIGDKIAAQFHFPSGVVGTFESMPVGNGSYGSDRLGVDFYFQDAVITARNQPKGQFHIFPRGDVFPTETNVNWEVMTTNKWNPVEINETLWSNHIICKDLVRIMKGSNPTNESSTIDIAVTGIEMLTAIYWSHLEGKRINLPLSNLENPWVGAP